MQIASATSLAVAHRRRDFAVWFPWEPIIIAIVLATWQRKKKKLLSAQFWRRITPRCPTFLQRAGERGCDCARGSVCMHARPPVNTPDRD